MFSRTKVERLFADRTKNTTIPNKSSTNMVLMLEVMNCILKKDVDFFTLITLLSPICCKGTNKLDYNVHSLRTFKSLSS